MSDITIGKNADNSAIIAGNENKVEVHHHHYPQPSPAPSPQKSATESLMVDLSSLPTTSPDFFGRSNEIDMLNRCWDSPKTSIVVLVAWGGVGKTSLVNHWLASMAQNDFHGAERIFGWSFYSQGAAEGKQASADRFIADALRWFGDPDPNQGDFADKAKRLSALIKQHRTLLILDGLEPLQAPPGPEEGRLKDQSLRILLRDLAVGQKGLCIITTRLWTDDLSTWRGRGVERTDLSHLAPEDGANLLKHLGVNGAEKELLNASVEFDGHALALTLLGTYLAAAYDGDVRQRDKIDCLMYEDMPQGKHARCVMESYEAWMLTTEKGRRELNILRMMGLFDRPAESGAIKALRAEPAITGLTDELKDVSEVQWQFALKNLRDLRLILEKDRERPDSLDCHPLIREHFGAKLKNENPDAWKEAHSRLYEYYKSLPEKLYGKFLPDTLEEMEPLFAAVAHGCKAGKYQEAIDDVFWKRIKRKEQYYSSKKLGAFSSELAALSNFFKVIWSEPADGIADELKAIILGWSGYGVRVAGYLREAIPLLKASLNIYIEKEDFHDTAACFGFISECYLKLGEINQAINYSQQSLYFADFSNNDRSRQVKKVHFAGAYDMNFLQEFSRVWLADALYQSGKTSESEYMFQEAFLLSKKRDSHNNLYALWGFRFSEFLLDIGNYQEVQERAIQVLNWIDKNTRDTRASLLDLGMAYLSLGCAHLVQVQKEKTCEFSHAKKYLNKAVDKIREAGRIDVLPLGYLASAALNSLKHEFPKAHADLDEAFDIADRSGMRLYLTDYHLESARLFLAENKPDKAKEHLASAKKLIAETGYHRRDKEAEELSRCLN